MPNVLFYKCFATLCINSSIHQAHLIKKKKKKIEKVNFKGYNFFNGYMQNITDKKRKSDYE